MKSVSSEGWTLVGGRGAAACAGGRDCSGLCPWLGRPSDRTPSSKGNTPPQPRDVCGGLMALPPGVWAGPLIFGCIPGSSTQGSSRPCAAETGRAPGQDAGKVGGSVWPGCLRPSRAGGPAGGPAGAPPPGSSGAAAAGSAQRAPGREGALGIPAARGEQQGRRRARRARAAAARFSPIFLGAASPGAAWPGLPGGRGPAAVAPGGDRCGVPSP